MSIKVHPCLPDLAVTIVPASPDALPAAIEDRVERIWQQEKAKRGKTLFNGEMLSVTELTGGGLVCRRVQYRWFVAQRTEPSLFAALAARPLAVTGILTCADGIVFGQRSAATMQDAGLWELAPAGGVDRPDFRAQLLAELAEEIGLHPSQVSVPCPMVLVEDLGSHVIDIVCALETAFGFDDVQAIHRVAGSDEYPRLAVVAPGGLDNFLDSHAVAPVSRAILAAVSREP